MKLNNLDVTHLVSLLESRLAEVQAIADGYRNDITRAIVYIDGIPNNHCIELKKKLEKCIEEEKLIEALINFYEENIFPFGIIKI